MSTTELQPRNYFEHNGRTYCDVTHVVTIPGTRYTAFLGDAYMTPPPARAGKWDWDTHTQGPDIQKPAKVEALLKALARTTVKGIGKRRVKAQPVLMTIQEFEALTTAKAA